MFRYQALGGASMLVLGGSLIALPSSAPAQTALPPVTVDAPRQAAAKPAARKPTARSVARTQARPPSANPPPAVSQAARITPSEARKVRPITASSFCPDSGMLLATGGVSRVEREN